MTEPECYSAGGHHVTAPNGWPRIGEISPDRTVIMGRQGFVFLFSGTNNYYEMFGTPRDVPAADAWAELTAQRHRAAGRTSVMRSLFLPNKASCLPDLYPALLPNPEIPLFSQMKSLMRGDRSVLFGNRLAELAAVDHRSAAHPWRFADSHWSPRGAHETFNEVVSSFGLARLPVRWVAQDSQYVSADLENRWPGRPLREFRDVMPTGDWATPTLAFDSGGGRELTAITGRRLVWENPTPLVDASVLLIGNSFCFLGTDPGQLTWWAARMFRTTTFLHSNAVPADAIAAIRPDFVLFQTVERFVHRVPTDALSLGDLDRTFQLANQL